MKVSFDFDGTLSKPVVQKIAKTLVNAGIEVWIVTRRYDSVEKYEDSFLEYYDIYRDNLEEAHNNLFKVADEVGIPRDRIKFTNMEYKYTFFKGTDFNWHLDDDFEDVSRINSKTKIMCYHFIEENLTSISDILLKKCNL